MLKLLEISSYLPPGDGVSTHPCRVFRSLGNLSRRNSLWSWTSQITRQFQNSNLVHIKLSFIYSMIRICGTLRILLWQRIRHVASWQENTPSPNPLHPGDPVWTISWLSATHLSRTSKAVTAYCAFFQLPEILKDLFWGWFFFLRKVIKDHSQDKQGEKSNLADIIHLSEVFPNKFSSLPILLKNKMYYKSKLSWSILLEGW